jgi:Domain of unknown function (DUF4145)
MGKYYPPEFEKKQFNCIHCGVFASQVWFTLGFLSNGVFRRDDDLDICACQHCSTWSYWYKGRAVVPSEAPVPPAHEDMPQQCRVDYDEARMIVAASPRSAAALLRLAVQKLMPVLGEKGKKINDDIGELVAKGLPVQVQQALDVCRVIGNNAVHPGEIDINDTPEIAHNLFDMLNFVVEDRISRPKRIQGLYAKLPEAARKAIDERDSNKD